MGSWVQIIGNFEDGKGGPQSPFQLKEELAARESMCGKRGEVFSALAAARFLSGSPLPALPRLPAPPFHIFSLDSAIHPLAGDRLLG